MKNIIKNVSNEIAKEIITRPKFDLEEISGIINFRLNESILEILLSNCEKEEITYHRLLLEQSTHKVGSKQYVEFGYKLSIAKNKKAIANRAVNNVKNKTKIGVILNYVKVNLSQKKLVELYSLMDENDSKNGN